MTATVSYLPSGDLPPDEAFTASQVIALTGITYRNLDYYCRSGLVSEQLANRHGSGNGRTFTLAEVDLIDLGENLIRAGFSVRAAFHVARSVQARDPHGVKFRIGGCTLTVERLDAS